VTGHAAHGPGAEEGAARSEGSGETAIDAGAYGSFQIAADGGGYRIVGQPQFPAYWFPGSRRSLAKLCSASGLFIPYG
jgi:hypothetical protein